MDFLQTKLVLSHCDIIFSLFFSQLMEKTIKFAEVHEVGHQISVLVLKFPSPLTSRLLPFLFFLNVDSDMDTTRLARHADGTYLFFCGAYDISF